VKRAITASFFVAALVGSLSSCGTDEKPRSPGITAAGSPSTSSAPAPAQTPAEAFAAAVTKFTGQNQKYTVEGDDGEVLTGEFDAATSGSKLSSQVDGSEVELVVLGNDVYIGGLIGPDKWMLAQAAKFKDSAVSFLIIVDPLFATKLLTTASNVKQDQPSAYSGTVDLTKVTATGVTKRIADKFAKAAGQSAAALPFTATVANGTLASLKITFPKADVGGKDLKYSLKVIESGGTVAVAAPPKSKVTDAPAAIYTGP
jgi:hypothetical protein